MKLMLGGTPVKKMMIHNDTMDATMVASDMQAGVTAYANGQKITGTGKSFEFACCGKLETNSPQYIPNNVNIVEIASVDNPIQLTVMLNEMKEVDFTNTQNIASAIVNGVSYPLMVQASDNFLTISCDKTISLQVFYGKDNYV